MSVVRQTVIDLLKERPMVIGEIIDKLAERGHRADSTEVWGALIGLKKENKVEVLASPFMEFRLVGDS